MKWIEDRREHLTAIGHSRESRCDVEIALRKDGTLLGLRGEIYVNIGAYVRPNGMTPVRNLAQFMSGPYRIPHIHLDAYAYVGNKTPAGTYRGPGRYEGCYFMERLIDLAATKLGIDRLELRRRNLVTDAEMPYPLATVLPSDGRAETSLDSGDHRSCFDRCLEEFDWAGKAHLQGQADRRDISRARHRLLRRGRRVGSLGSGAHAGRGRRQRVGLCRLFGRRPGPRNRFVADRGGCARNLDGPHPSLPWLDDLSEGGLGILRIARDCHGRQCGRRCGDASFSNGSAASPPQGSA